MRTAGRPGGIGAGDFIAVRYMLAPLVTILGILIGALTQNRALLACGAAIGAVIGLYGPMLWLRLRLRRRRADIQADLADVIDVLVVCVEAGLTFEAAMEKVVEKYDHGLADEFGRVMQEGRLAGAAFPAGHRLACAPEQAPSARSRRSSSAPQRSCSSCSCSA